MAKGWPSAGLSRARDRPHQQSYCFVGLWEPGGARGTFEYDRAERRGLDLFWFYHVAVILGRTAEFLLVYSMGMEFELRMVVGTGSLRRPCDDRRVSLLGS